MKKYERRLELAAVFGATYDAWDLNTEIRYKNRSQQLIYSIISLEFVGFTDE